MSIYYWQKATIIFVTGNIKPRKKWIESQDFSAVNSIDESRIKQALQNAKMEILTSDLMFVARCVLQNQDTKRHTIRNINSKFSNYIDIFQQRFTKIALRSVIFK